MAKSGAYDHPSYLCRQLICLGVTTAGANGTSCQRAFPVDIRIRNVSAAVVTAGTSAGSGHAVNIYAGTTSIGAIALNTLTAGQNGTSGDLNTTLAAGTNFATKNGTDATGVAAIVLEASIPVGSTWS